MKALVLRAGVAAAAGLGAWARWVEPRRLVVREVDLCLPAWPAERDGFRLALVSDVHAGVGPMDAARVGRVASAVRDARPDLVAVLGDLIDRGGPGEDGAAPPEPVAARLGDLGAPLGTVAVLGNHDWKGAGGVRVERALALAGVRVLENQAVRLDPGAPELWVAGLADATMRTPDVAGALAPVPTGATVLVLSHDPDVFPRIPPRVALTVSGHTHAGQIALPVLRRFWIPSQHGERYAGGHVAEDGRHLYVSRGIGASRVSVRLGAPPEVVLLRLFAAAPGAGAT